MLKNRFSSLLQIRSAFILWVLSNRISDNAATILLKTLFPSEGKGRDDDDDDDDDSLEESSLCGPYLKPFNWRLKHFLRRNAL